MGLLNALDPVIRRPSARATPAVARGVQRGVVLAGVLGVLAALACPPVRFLLTAAGQPLRRSDGAVAYVVAQAPTYWAFFLFIAAHDAAGEPPHEADRLGIVLSNFFNGFVCWTLVRKVRAARARAAGAGIGTALARCSCSVCSSRSRSHVRPWLRWTRESLQPGPLRRILRIGLPIAAQYEFGSPSSPRSRSSWGAWAGRGNAHQVALNIASFTFMVPLGVSIAGSVLVGQAVGAGEAAARALGSPRSSPASVSCAERARACAIPGVLARIYSSDAQVIALASTLIPIAGCSRC